MAKDRTHNSLQTVSSLLGGMIGGTILVLPILFKQVGWAQGLFFLALQAFLYYWNAVITYHVLEPHEMDQGEAIIRLLGNWWERVFELACFF